MCSLILSRTFRLIYPQSHAARVFFFKKSKSKNVNKKLQWLLTRGLTGTCNTLYSNPECGEVTFPSLNPFAFTQNRNFEFSVVASSSPLRIRTIRLYFFLVTVFVLPESPYVFRAQVWNVSYISLLPCSDIPDGCAFKSPASTRLSTVNIVQSMINTFSKLFKTYLNLFYFTNTLHSNKNFSRFPILKGETHLRFDVEKKPGKFKLSSKSISI